jgi:two-component sensor histidine kinase
MAFHELITNAIKYGALSGEHGRVRVSWTIEPGDPEMLFVHWQEEGGPEVEAPSESGFGTRMIESLLRGEFEGEVSFDYPPEGFVFSCRCVYFRP